MYWVRVGEGRGRSGLDAVGFHPAVQKSEGVVSAENAMNPDWERVGFSY
jgi:hypothetical protein